MNKKINIAVDGTAGSGKTSTFKIIANKLNYKFIDTGLMYRAFTKFCFLKKINFLNENEIKNNLDNFNIEYLNNGNIFINSEEYFLKDLTDQDVLQNINYITKIDFVREWMVKKQRNLVINGGNIIVGRDITSVVLPNSELKIFFDCNVDVRAARRFEEMKLINKNFNMTLEQIKDEIIKRDLSDKMRDIGPLIRTSDSWYIDSSNYEINQIVDIVIKKVNELQMEK